MLFSATPKPGFSEECSDEELMLQLQKGERLALNRIMVRYKQRLFAFICRYTGRDEIAYDILQETFTRLYFASPSFNPQYRFSTWLFQIALNLCRDQHRKRKREAVVFLDQGADPAPLIDSFHSQEPDPEERQALRSELRRLDREIRGLPHKLKSALIAFAVEERSQEECARLLGITTKTLEMRVYRARKLLEERLAETP